MKKRKRESKKNSILKKNLKWIIIAATIIVIVILFFVFKPYKKENSFGIIDKCGVFANLYSHTINDDSNCELQCKSQCNAKELAFRRAEFEYNPLGCHNCTCYCK